MCHKAQQFFIASSGQQLQFSPGAFTVDLDAKLGDRVRDRVALCVSVVSPSGWHAPNLSRNRGPAASPVSFKLQLNSQGLFEQREIALADY